MKRIGYATDTRTRIMRLGLGLAAVAALSYLLMGLRVLGSGDADGPPFIVYTAATCYFAGGLLFGHLPTLWAPA